MKITSKLSDSSQATEYQFDIESQNNEISLNNIPQDWDIQEIKEGTFHIIRKGQSYRAELVAADYQKKSFTLKINDRHYEIQGQDKLDQLLKSLGMEPGAGLKISEIKAPMPGLILDIKVEKGQEIQKDEVVCILEAMKMENIIKSPTDGVIKKILVEKGKNVEKNAVLLQFE